MITKTVWNFGFFTFLFLLPDASPVEYIWQRDKSFWEINQGRLKWKIYNKLVFQDFWAGVL
jgi:hypothetical protein